jgi:hypothetical protein
MPLFSILQAQRKLSCYFSTFACGTLLLPLLERHWLTLEWQQTVMFDAGRWLGFKDGAGLRRWWAVARACLAFNTVVPRCHHYRLASYFSVH